MSNFHNANAEGMAQSAMAYVFASFVVGLVLAVVLIAVGWRPWRGITAWRCTCTVDRGQIRVEGCSVHK